MEQLNHLEVPKALCIQSVREHLHQLEAKIHLTVVNKYQKLIKWVEEVGDVYSASIDSATNLQVI